VAVALRIEVVWSDEDVAEVRVSAFNGRFAGQVDAYVARGRLTQVATDLEGFPRKAGDSRNVIIGAFGPECAGGAARLRFLCVDPAGHARFDAELEAEAHDTAFEGRRECARVMVRFELAAFDRFVAQLKSVAARDHGFAELQAVEGAV